jgi:hypothetical protein
LLGCHANGLDGKFSLAHIKEILQVRPEQIDNQDVVQSFLSEMVNLRNALWRTKTGPGG